MYAVVTTRIYCRPGCDSRTPHQANVRLFPDGAEARKECFRPCKRCLPDETPDWASRTLSVSQMCRLIEESSRTPTLTQLAQSIGYRPFHSHRMFLEVTGVTPRAYAVTVRTSALKTSLGAKEKVSDAIHDDRTISAAQFFADMSRELGMPPTTFVKGGRACVPTKSPGPWQWRVGSGVAGWLWPRDRAGCRHRLAPRGRRWSRAGSGG